MVLLNVALLTPQEVLLARSFVPLTKQRQDHLLRACCRLLEIDSQIKDHSFLEAESVRYLYLPIGDVFLVLTTTKASNVMEDLTTLKMLQTVVQNKMPTQITPEHIEEHAFDLIFAFDECASFGHRESVTLKQIEAYCAAESYEEEIAKQLRKQKEDDERRKRREKAMELDKKRLEEVRAQKKREQSANLQAGAALLRAAVDSATQGAAHFANESNRPSWGATQAAQSAPEEQVTVVSMDSTSNNPPRKGTRGMQLGGGRGGLRGL